MIIILMGPMGCGKTTIGWQLSQRMGWRFEDADDFHPQQNVEKMGAGIPLDDADRLPWLAILRDMIDRCLAKEEHLILACSALKEYYRHLLGVDQQKVVTVYLCGSFDLLLERLQGRSHRYMKDSLLKSQLETLEEPQDGLKVSIAGDPTAVVEEIATGLEALLHQQKHYSK